MDQLLGQTYSRNLIAPTLTKPSATDSSEVLRQKAEEFESGFLQTMLSTMMETVEDDALTGQSFVKDSYNGMLVEELAKEISAAGGIGLADHVYRTLLTAQEDAR